MGLWRIVDDKSLLHWDLITGEFIMTVTILIPCGSRVFLLDDDDVRIRWFVERLTSITVAKEAPDAITILDSYPPFDFLFLDHDLGLFTAPKEMACRWLNILPSGASKAWTHLFIPRIRMEQGTEKGNSSAVR